MPHQKTTIFTPQTSLQHTMKQGIGRASNIYNAISLTTAKVIDIHPEKGTVDLRFARGQRVFGVKVLSREAGTQGGIAYLQSITHSSPARDNQGSLDGFEDDGHHSCYALVTFIEGAYSLPVVLGYIWPPVTQMLFKEKGLKIERHSESNIYQLWDKEGNYELVSPDGSYLHLGPAGSSHRDLSKTDMQKSWSIPLTDPGVFEIVHASGSSLSLGTEGVSSSSSLGGTSLQVTGTPDAPLPFTLIGAIASGHPTTGLHQINEVVLDISLGNQKWWICTVAGTPGTWQSF